MGEASPAECAPAQSVSSADPSAPSDGAGPPAVMAEAAEDLADLLIQVRGRVFNTFPDDLADSTRNLVSRPSRNVSPLRSPLVSPAALPSPPHCLPPSRQFLSQPPPPTSPPPFPPISTVSSPCLPPSHVQGARYGDMDDVAAALDGGADAGVADDEGRTALHMAAANGHTEIARLLIQRGAPVNAVNRQGNTPLHWAAVNGRDSVSVEESAGGMAGTQGEREGLCECMWEQGQMVHLLIAAGASPSALNSHERTPMDEAIHSNNQLTLDATGAAPSSCPFPLCVLPVPHDPHPQSAIPSHERTPVDEAIHSNNQLTLDAINTAVATRDAASLSVAGSHGDDTGGDSDGEGEATDIME
ncbi:unnamed protein product [Closterium sp. Naga37s-1]|nr:unnamed protein product [Closterium sp. Naga37s-1]